MSLVSWVSGFLDHTGNKSSGNVGTDGPGALDGKPPGAHPQEWNTDWAVHGSGLNAGLQDRSQQGLLGDLDKVLSGGPVDPDDGTVNNVHEVGLGGDGGGNLGVDGLSLDVEDNAAVSAAWGEVLSGEKAGGQDAASGLGGEGSVGDLNLLGDLVGENGDSEDGGEAGNGEDGSDDNSNLHALDGTFNVGQLSLEAGHGGSSFSFHFWF